MQILPRSQEFTYDIVKSFYVIGELFACIVFHCKDVSSNLSLQKPNWYHWRARCYLFLKTDNNARSESCCIVVK